MSAFSATKLRGGFCGQKIVYRDLYYSERVENTQLFKRHGTVVPSPLYSSDNSTILGKDLNFLVVFII